MRHARRVLCRPAGCRRPAGLRRGGGGASSVHCHTVCVHSQISPAAAPRAAAVVCINCGKPLGVMRILRAAGICAPRMVGWVGYGSVDDAGKLRRRVPHACAIIQIRPMGVDVQRINKGNQGQSRNGQRGCAKRRNVVVLTPRRAWRAARL